MNCYLRQRVLACHVCLYQSASHPCIHTHLVSSVQLHCSRSGKAERVVDYGTIISYFMMPLSALIALAGKPLSPLILLMFVYFIMDIVQSWATIFRIAHHKNYPWCALIMAQGFPELDNSQLTSWSESLSTFIQLETVMNELLSGWRNMTEGGFLVL